MINLNSSIYRLRLDLHEATAQDSVILNKGETTRRIEIELYENNAPWEFTGNVTAAICISGEEDIFPVDIVGNTVVYEALGELTGTVGIREVQVRIMESGNTSVDPDEPNTDKLLYAPKFTAIINGVVNDGTATGEQARQGDLIARLEEVWRRAVYGEFDGYSPTVSISDIQGGHSVTITSKDEGEIVQQSFNVMDGEKGEDGAPGADGYSPTVTVENIPNGHRVTITDASGPHTFNVMDGSGGGSDVPVFVITWYNNPTEAQKTNIVGTFALMSAITDKKYICYLHIYGTNRYLAAEITYVSSTSSYSGISSIEWVDHTRGAKYTISAASVDTYSQSSTTLYEEEDFDPQGNKPALQSVTADYVDDKLDGLSIPTKTSDLTNDSGFITSSALSGYATETYVGTAIANKADKSSIVTSGTTFTAADNTEYRFSEAASLTMTFPTTIPERFDIFVSFTSGTTATAFTFPTGIKWSGDDITDGEFVPAVSKRYNMALWYDGSVINGIVRGVA